MDAVRRLLCPLGLAAAVGCNSGSSALDSRFGNNPILNSSIRSQAPDDPPPVTPVAATVARSGPDPSAGSPQVRVAALIGSDVVVTDDEVWAMVRQRGSQFAQLTGDARAAAEKQIFREELRKLIERELIIADFVGKVKKNKPQALDELKEETQKAAAKNLKEFKKKNNITSEEQFQAALRSQSLSQKMVERQLERQAMSGIYLDQLMRDKTKVWSFSLADLTRYYNTHPAEFKLDDNAKWLDLFVSARRFNTPDEAKQYADWLAGQAATGVDFVGLVKQYGHGDSPLRNGEGLGAKRGEIVPRDLEATVFATPAGQVAGPIPTETGYHVIKVVERETAGTRPFDDKTQMYIRAKLRQEVWNTEYDKLIEDLWRKTTVKIIDLP